MKRFYVLCGASLGLVILGVGLSSLASASVPRSGNTLDDTSIVGTVSEIRVGKLGSPSFDEDLEALAGHEALYREKLLTEAELAKQERARELKLARLNRRASRMAPVRSAWRTESRRPKLSTQLAEELDGPSSSARSKSVSYGRVQGGKVIAKTKTHWVIPDAAPSTVRADGSQPQVIRQGKHVFILQ